MSTEKETMTIDGYAELHKITFGNTFYFVGENLTEEQPYILCKGIYSDFGLTAQLILKSHDYHTILRNFACCIEDVLSENEDYLSEYDILHMLFSEKDCIPNSHDMDYQNQLVVINPKYLSPIYRTQNNQLHYVTHGNGCKSERIGRSVFTKNLLTGETGRWYRNEILGVIKPECIPSWFYGGASEIVTKFLPEKAFLYGNYYFIPHREFKTGEGEFLTIMNYCVSDRDMGITTYDWQKYEYSHKSFYEAANADDCDIFKRLDNGKLYIPCENELFIYNEPKCRKN